MIGRVKDHLGVERVLNYQWGGPVRMPYHDETADISTAPPFLSLKDKAPPIRDQGELGACTQFSFRTMFWFAMLKAGKVPFESSPLFGYYNERKMNGQINEDAGASISDEYRAANLYGVCPEARWPYDTSRFTVEPPQSVYAAAVDVKAHIYAPVPQKLENLVGLIHRNQLPGNYGISVYSSFMDKSVARTGVVPIPKSSEALLGGHALPYIGYNAQSQENLGIPPLSVVVPNSWGTLWGASGYCFIPFDYILDPQLASDFWMIRVI